MESCALPCIELGLGELSHDCRSSEQTLLSTWLSARNVKLRSRDDDNSNLLPLREADTRDGKSSGQYVTISRSVDRSGDRTPDMATLDT